VVRAAQDHFPGERSGTIRDPFGDARRDATPLAEGRTSLQLQAKRVFSVSDLQTYGVGTEVNVFFDSDDPETATVTGVASPRR
jgi:hypothetical protein